MGDGSTERATIAYEVRATWYTTIVLENETGLEFGEEQAEDVAAQRLDQDIRELLAEESPIDELMEFEVIGFTVVDDPDKEEWQDD